MDKPVREVRIIALLSAIVGVTLFLGSYLLEEHGYHKTASWANDSGMGCWLLTMTLCFATPQD